jgi:hypothetical protein
MRRDQKTKSKVTQAQSATSKQQVRPAAAPLDPGTTQAMADTPHASGATISPQQEQDAAGLSSPIQQSTTSQQAVWTGLQPSWPSWPTSKPGPRSTPPAPGARPINKFRPEQFKELAYDQETGEPATQSPFRSLPDERTTGPSSFDQPTAQDVLGKRKQRL